MQLNNFVKAIEKDCQIIVDLWLRNAGHNAMFGAILDGTI